MFDPSTATTEELRIECVRSLDRTITFLNERKSADYLAARASRSAALQERSNADRARNLARARGDVVLDSVKVFAQHANYHYLYSTLDEVAEFYRAAGMPQASAYVLHMLNRLMCLNDLSESADELDAAKLERFLDALPAVTPDSLGGHHATSEG